MGGPVVLVDCNNFYVSCERVFQSQLRGRPVGSGANRLHEHACTCRAVPPSGPQHCIPDCGHSSTLNTETSQPDMPFHSDSLLDASMILNQVVQVYRRA
jgi:hypothetical protein